MAPPRPFGRFQVWLVGLDEPLEVQTNALDWRDVPMDPNAPKALDVIYRVTHSALLRAGAEGIPRHYDRYCSMLAANPEAIDEAADEVTAALDPTPSSR